MDVSAFTEIVSAYIPGKRPRPARTGGRERAAPWGGGSARPGLATGRVVWLAMRQYAEVSERDFVVQIARRGRGGATPPATATATTISTAAAIALIISAR